MASLSDASTTSGRAVWGVPREALPFDAIFNLLYDLAA
jgi:hypothetical protein